MWRTGSWLVTNMLWSLFLPPLCQVDNSLYHRFTPHHLQIGPEVKIFRARPSHDQTLSLVRAESTRGYCGMWVMLPPPVSGTNPRLILTSLASRAQSTNGIIMSPLWTLWLCNPVSTEQSALTVIDLICQLHCSSAPPHPVMCHCVSVVLTIVIWLTLATQYLKHILDQMISQYIQSCSTFLFKNSILINSKTCFSRHDCVLSAQCSARAGGGSFITWCDVNTELLAAAVRSEESRVTLHVARHSHHSHEPVTLMRAEYKKTFPLWSG